MFCYCYLCPSPYGHWHITVRTSHSFSQICNIALIMSLLCPVFFQNKYWWCLNSDIYSELNPVYSARNTYLKPNLVLWLIPDHFHLICTSCLFYSLQQSYCLYSLILPLLSNNSPPLIDPSSPLGYFTHSFGFSYTMIAPKFMFHSSAFKFQT